VIDPLIAVRAVHLAATAAAGGAIFFRLWVAAPAIRRAGAGPALGAWLDARLARIAWGGLALVVLSAAGWLMLVAADVSDRLLGGMPAGDVIATVVTDTRFGHVWIARIAVALLLALCLLRSKSDDEPLSGRGTAATVLAAALLGGLALAGHGGSTPGTAGSVHLASDIAHAIAAGAWVGGLVPLALLFAAVLRATDVMAVAMVRDATRRFSTLGLVSVATLLATGIVNTVYLVGSVPGLLGTTYGRLLLAKIVLFVAMVAIAAVNRLRLTPRLTGNGAANAMRRLRRNSLVEAILGLAVLAIVGALGTIPPALHVEPWWPLPFRLDGGAFTAPDLRLNAILAAAVAGAAIAAWVRRWRWPAIVLGVIALACLGWNLRFVAVTAFPTSFYQSPTNFTVASIARGQELFAAHCAGCHGNAGRGNGPNALALDMETSDLTADHIYDHPDGDLFWWIGHGIDETMPGFATAIDDGARWNLIDFIHANADAVRLQRRGHDGLNAFPAPSLTAECPDGATVAIEDLRGRFVRLLVTGAGSMPQASHAAIRADVATIIVPVDRANGEAAGACMVHDPNAVATLAIYRGGDVSALAGTQFLVDPDGRLRAMWHPGLAPDWNDPGALDREIETLRDTPPIERPARPRGHAH
jgi:putative copper export protein/mono/diheme cytochrome c family protein